MQNVTKKKTCDEKKKISEEIDEKNTVFGKDLLEKIEGLLKNFKDDLLNKSVLAAQVKNETNIFQNHFVTHSNKEEKEEELNKCEKNKKDIL